jgi:hypothetical protein
VHITRRHLQVTLALLWLIDGALQLQPFMFGRGFTNKILDPAIQGQPGVVAAPLREVAHLVSAHPALANGTFAFIQIALGIALLSRRYSRRALGASIAWALGVWIVGEGLGGVATGSTLLGGAPGAALLYAVIAVVAWPTHDSNADERPSWIALPAWCALWLGGAVLQLVAGNNSSMSFTMMLRSAQSGAPSWIGGIDRHLAQLHLPSWTAALAISLYVLVAIWVLVPGWTRQLSIGIGTVLALTGWLLFQGLGDLSSGEATDLNTGPLVVLLAVAVLSAAYPREIADEQLGTFASTRPVLRSGLAISGR